MTINNEKMVAAKDSIPHRMAFNVLFWVSNFGNKMRNTHYFDMHDGSTGAIRPRS